MKSVPLAELMVRRGGSVTPGKFPDERFDLFSIPAHDNGGFETVAGAAIGSSKQSVQPGDVLISKIVPHIRRARVVSPAHGRRQIASGEWIVLRGEAFIPDYLRHFLISDGFHRQFMTTVAGVGGSLLRARPQQVGTILVPLPTLEEQRRIAAILDQADLVRARRRQALAHLDDLIQSIFLDMFGDPTQHVRGWSSTQLGEVCIRVTDGEHQTPPRESAGVPLLSARSVRNGWIDFTATDFVSEAQYDILRRRIEPATDDILISCSGTIGRVARVREVTRFAMVRSAALVRPGPELNPVFLEGLLRTASMRALMNSRANSSAQANLFQNQIKSLPAITPPRALQDAYAVRMASADQLEIRLAVAAASAEELARALQAQLFMRPGREDGRAT